MIIEKKALAIVNFETKSEMIFFKDYLFKPVKMDNFYALQNNYDPNINGNN